MNTRLSMMIKEAKERLDAGEVPHGAAHGPTEFAGFKAMISRTLGTDVLEALDRVVFDDGRFAGLAMTFEVDGTTFWLEQVNGDIVRVVMVKDGPLELTSFCANDLGSRDRFLSALWPVLTDKE